MTSIIRLIFTVITLVALVLFLVLIIAFTSNRVASARIDQQTAGLILTAVSLQMSIALTMLKHTWGAYHRIASSIPGRERRIRLILKDIAPTERNRHSLLALLVCAAALLSLSLFLHLFTLLGVGDILLGLPLTGTTQENYHWGLICAEWGLLLFVCGTIAAAIAYITEAIDFIRGKRSPLFSPALTSTRDSDAGSSGTKKPSIEQTTAALSELDQSPNTIKSPLQPAGTDEKHHRKQTRYPPRRKRKP